MLTAEFDGLLGVRYSNTWKNNLLQLNWEMDFLAPFEPPRQTGQHYIGLGKSLEAVSRFAANTKEPALLCLRGELLNRIASFQESGTGYIGLFPRGKRITELWDLHEQAYLVLGLLADWRLFQDPMTAAILHHLGGYLKDALQSPAFDQIDFRSDDTAVHKALGLIALDLALIELYRFSKDAVYLNLAKEKLRLNVWDLEIVKGRFPPLHGHAYAYMARCLALMELNQEAAANPSLPKPVQRVLDHLFRDRSLLVSGTMGVEECWCGDHTCTGDVGETCATTYLMRLMDALYRFDGNTVWFDVLERSLFNAFLAAQSPDARRIRYYTAHQGERVYFDRDTYCCPGNFRRMMATLPQLLYHAHAYQLDIRIPVPGRIQIPLAGAEALELMIEGNYPYETQGRIRVISAPSYPYCIRLRLPGWSGRPKAESTCCQATKGKSNWATFQSVWQAGDSIQYDFPAEAQWIAGEGRQTGKVAYLEGCLVYGSEMDSPTASNGLKPFHEPSIRSIYRNAQNDPAANCDPIYTIQ